MDNLTREQRRKNMQNIRSTGTLPERTVMTALRRKRIYFAVYVASLPGKPDIVFRRKRIAVFIDSDFWHGHPRRFRMPASNRDYWEPKIRRNKARDRAVNRELRQMGWRVIRLWEYDIRHNWSRVLRRLMTVLDKSKKGRSTK